MTMMDSTTLMTTQDLLAMPEDGIDRELSRGRLRELSMTRRGRRHTKTGSKITTLLSKWLELQPSPRGEVLTGDAGFQLQHDPDTTVGIDVAYISPETARSTPEDAYIIDDIPVLAVEILSPSDSQEGIYDKVRDYMDAKVPIVWLVEPVFKTVTVYRPGKPPEMFAVGQEITAEPNLPGFKAPVLEIFE